MGHRQKQTGIGQIWRDWLQPWFSGASRKKTTSKRALSCWTNRNICHPKENQVWLILTRRVHVGNHERCCWVAARFCPPQSPPDPPCSVTVCCWGHLLSQWIQLSWDPEGSPLCTLKPKNKPWSGMEWNVPRLFLLPRMILLSSSFTLNCEVSNHCHGDFLNRWLGVILLMNEILRYLGCRNLSNPFHGAIRYQR